MSLCRFRYCAQVSLSFLVDCFQLLKIDSLYKLKYIQYTNQAGNVKTETIDLGFLLHHILLLL